VTGAKCIASVIGLTFRVKVFGKRQLRILVEKPVCRHVDEIKSR